MPPETAQHPAAPEQRTATVEVESVRTDGRTLHGFACLYGAESRDLGGFTERIEPGAFTGALADNPDVLLTFNHSPDKVLARTRSGTLKLSDEARGLAFEAELGDGPTAQDVRDMVRRGDLSGASFRFVVAPDGEQWHGERRTLTKVAELIDVSLATTPAYDGPSVELRTRPETTDKPAPPETTHPAPAEEEDTVNTEDRTEGGGLAVEDRAETAEQRPIEQRVGDALRSVRKGEARSLTTSNVDGIAPPELSSFIFDKLRASSIALAAGIRVIATNRESIQWPQITADVDPTWVAETELIPAGDPVFAPLTAAPKKLAHRVEVSNEVIDDSEPSIVDVLNGHLAVMLGLKLDRSIFEGNPAADADSIRGLKYVGGIQEVDLGANGDVLYNYDALLEAVGLLRAANVPEPYAIASHPRTLTSLELLKETTGPQLARPGGLPAILTSSQLSINEAKGTSTDTSSAYVFAPAEVVLVRRQDATIELDRSRLFDRDMSELRGKLRADLICPNPSAIVRVRGIKPTA